jgi:CMP-N-acetylneuraminic acid synthetase
MLKDLIVTAVIPVRGGSKGIPRKNLYRLGNDSLLERAIKIGLSCNRVDKVIVSTDDPEMFGVAKRYGVAPSEMRPDHLAGDTSSTIDVVLDLIDKGHVKNGLVLLLQVTSPLRTLSDLNSFMDEFEKTPKDCLALASVVKFESPHPDKIQTIVNGYLKPYTGKESMVARQLLPPVYALNGAFYINSTVSILRDKTMLPRNTRAFEMSVNKSLNLDSHLDLLLLEALIKTGNTVLEEY